MRNYDKYTIQYLQIKQVVDLLTMQISLTLLSWHNPIVLTRDLTNHIDSQSSCQYVS